MDLLPRLITFLRAHPNVVAALPWVVGVSGGPDSLALAHLLRRLFEEQQLAVPPHIPNPLTVAHLDHGLRTESRADADYVARTARDWALPVEVERCDVGAFALQNRLSIEEAGRQARYAMLARVAAAHAAGAVFTAHNADDQAETVLMHLLRGAGLAGLRGMLPVSKLAGLRLPDATPPPALLLVRPLLETPRAEIEAYCAAHDLVPRRDASNADVAFFRNRLRHEVLPLLEKVNPNVRAVLRRTGDVAAADYDVLTQVRDEAWEALLATHEPPHRIALRREPFAQLLPGLQRALLRKAMAALRPDLRNVDFTPIAHAAELAAGGATGQQATLPGNVTMVLDYEHIVLTTGSGEVAPDEHMPLMATDAFIPLPAHGRLAVGDGGWQVEIGLADAVSPAIAESNPDRWQAFLDADRLGEPLALRTRRPGDRFAPHGMGGHSQKISDFMINARIPAALRDRLPLLVGGEQVAWVPGWRVDHRVRVTAETARMLRARFIEPPRGGPRRPAGGQL